MTGFRSFKQASSGATPKFLQAEIDRAKARDVAKARAATLRQQNAVQAAGLYDAGMESAGKSPIADFITGVGSNAPLTHEETVSGLANNASADAGANASMNTLQGGGYPTNLAPTADAGGGVATQDTAAALRSASLAPETEAVTGAGDVAATGGADIAATGGADIAAAATAATPETAAAVESAVAAGVPEAEATAAVTEAATSSAATGGSLASALSAIPVWGWIAAAAIAATQA